MLINKTNHYTIRKNGTCSESRKTEIANLCIQRIVQSTALSTLGRLSIEAKTKQHLQNVTCGQVAMHNVLRVQMRHAGSNSSNNVHLCKKMR